MTTWTKTRPTLPGVYLYRQKTEGRWTEPMRMTIASNGAGSCDDFAVLNPEDAEWWVEEAPAWTKTPPSEPGWYWWRTGDNGIPSPVYLSPKDDRAAVQTVESKIITKRLTGPYEIWPVRIEPPKEQA